MALAHQQLTPEGILPENVRMTLEEFLASDVDGYEYVKGELVPMRWFNCYCAGNVALQLLAKECDECKGGFLYSLAGKTWLFS